MESQAGSEESPRDERTALAETNQALRRFVALQEKGEMSGEQLEGAIKKARRITRKNKELLRKGGDGA